MTTISVVIPNYNMAHLLGAALESVARLYVSKLLDGDRGRRDR